MRYYPILLDLTAMSCLVVGAGEVGERKILGLLECSPRTVLAVDTNPPSRALTALLASASNFAYEQRPFTATDLQGQQLVFACTSNRTVNAEISQICKDKQILCNTTDAPDDGNFVLPASIVQGDLTITVSTSGASPALSKIIRQELEDKYGPEYRGFTRLLKRVREALLPLGMTSSENRIIFRKLASSPLPALMREKDFERCAAQLRQILPASLHPRIGEWCDDCFKTF